MNINVESFYLLLWCFTAMMLPFYLPVKPLYVNYCEWLLVPHQGHIDYKLKYKILATPYMNQLMCFSFSILNLSSLRLIVLKLCRIYMKVAPCEHLNASTCIGLMTTT